MSRWSAVLSGDENAQYFSDSLLLLWNFGFTECFSSNLLGLGWSSLSIDHNWEALEVSQVLACSLSGNLLSDWGWLPLGLKSKFLDFLEETSSANSTWDIKLELGERESSKWIEGSWDVLSINENARSVSNINDNNRLSVVISVVNKGNSTWLNKSPVTLHTKSSLNYAQNLRMLRERGHSAAKMLTLETWFGALFAIRDSNL